ncbi:MAG: zinc-ribbon domain-containing protein [Bacteroidales bacterium]|nr:zinc-ribbon domain-containing protein [Lachnoclostridium sp.]MCM1383393.1 zinc-ribbon domain-containing protein [Lachnoclostridium sp.]MCM1464241.1 zinc-ribbon domain-containing protein [Bacteroidales bacterium]
MICSKCGANMPDSNMFCERCGNKLGDACPRCGAPFKPDAKFCEKCGMKRDSQPEMPAMKPASATQQETKAEQPVSAQQTTPTVQQETPVAQSVTAQQETQVVQPAPASQPTAAPTVQPTPVQQPAPTSQPTAAPQAAPTAQPTPVQQPAPAPQPTATPTAQPTPVQQPTPMPQPTVTPQAAPVQQSAPAAQPAQPQQKKPKKKKGPIIFIIILVLLIAALAGGYVYFVKVLEKNPFEVVKEMFTSDKSDEEKEGDDKDSKETDADADKKADKDNEAQKGEKADKGDITLLDPAGELVKKAGEQFDAGHYIEEDGAIYTAEEAITMYITVAKANNLKEEAQQGIQEAFQVYSQSVTKYCDMIKKQGAYVEGFNEITAKLSDAADVITTVTEAGYTVDGQEIETYRTAIIPEFKDKFIKSINSFTERENWSRDEAWSYAERAYAIKENGKPLLFDDTDLEDPLRMRYAYCLAWITRKRCETGLQDGSMTPADAANSMIAILKETDYNLLLLQDIITYGSSAAMDVTQYQNAYNAIVDQIKSEQGLTIGTDIAVNSTSSVNLTHFWYFNDLDGEDKYKVDLYNGTTAATREWIRSNIPVMLGE